MLFRSTSFGSTSASTKDSSNRNVSITQSTSARRPLKSVVSNVASWTFDGVDDWFDTGTINLSATQAVTIAIVEQQTNNAFSYEVDIGASPTRFFLARRNNVASRNVSAVSFGNVGISNIWSTGAFNSASVIVGKIDWSKPSGSEAEIFVNGTAPATATGAVNNTGNFGNQAGKIGAAAIGDGSGPYGGWIASIIVFSRALTTAEIALLSSYLLRRAGLA